MSHAGKDPNKRHRHDVGEVSHGATTQENVTRGIQYTLALCVIATAVLVLYALAAGGRQAL